MRFVFFLLCLSCGIIYSFGQVPGSLKHGPKGVFIFLGNDIPSGKTISAYTIERSSDSIHWNRVADITTPNDFKSFKDRFNIVKEYFPSFPVPPDDKLSLIFQKASATGSVDSLKNMRITFPIRMALGLMYYDTSALKHIKYQYKITAIRQNVPTGISRVTDTISLPFYQKFDSIRISSSSYNKTSISIKWKSVGKNPAPLFMVYKNKYDVPVVARGATSRYNVNDTSFYVYTDSVLVTESGRELQYYILPFDQYGNTGTPSKPYLIPLDGFNKGDFLYAQTDFVPLLSGVRISWKFSNPGTLKSVEIYRNESASGGFSKLAVISAADTIYVDNQIWPERTYTYYIQVMAKDDKRTRQSKAMRVTVPGIVMPEKLIAPVLHKAELINGKPCLVIEVKDTAAAEIRIYRGIADGLTDLPGRVKINKRKIVLYTDTDFDSVSMKEFKYAVRNEKEGIRVSELSQIMKPEVDTNATDIGYFMAFQQENKTELYWDNLLKKNTRYSSYSLARKTGQANSRSPLKIIAENLREGYFEDKDAPKGSQYTYELRLLDKTGNFIGKTYKVTTNP